MKTKIFTLLMIAFLCGAGAIFAQIPQGINYQAVVRNSSGTIVANGAATFRFSFHEGSASGTIRYRETFSVTTDAYGMANVVLGSGVIVSGTFAAVDWTKSNYLQTEVNLTGSFVNLGTTKFQSVPYALNSGGGGWTASGNNLYNSNTGNVGIGTNNPNQKLHVVIPASGYARFEGLGSESTLQFTNSGSTMFIGQGGWNMAATSIGIGNANTPTLVVDAATNRVGVGNGNPDAKLTIGSPGTTWTDYGITSDSRIGVVNGAGGRRAIIMGAASYGGYIGAFDYGSGTQIDVAIQNENNFRVQGDGYIRMCTSDDNSTGNIGMGTGVYNNCKLTVSSNQTFALAVEGVAGKTGGGSWSGISDARLKKDIGTYSDGLSTLLKIKPVTYHYNEISGFNMETEYVGVLAQELQAVAPYMVTSSQFKNTGKEYLQVDNSAMTYMLINAVKEQQAQIDALKAEIAAMKH